MDKTITITIEYDSEYKEAQINMSTGLYNNTDYGTCDSCHEVRDAIIYATQEIMEILGNAGMKA